MDMNALDFLLVCHRYLFTTLSKHQAFLICFILAFVYLVDQSPGE